MPKTNMAARFEAIAAEQTTPHQPPPEIALLVAVLGSAVTEASWPVAGLSSGSSGSSKPSAAHRHAAWQWLLDDALEPWTAAWVCQHLHLDLVAIRSAVTRARETGRRIEAGHLFHGQRTTSQHRVQAHSARAGGRHARRHHD